MAPDEKARILAVDDTEDNLELIRDLFADLPYELDTARDAKTAMDLAREVVPDLFILDVQMPEMDGYELCQRLREGPDTQRTPIIFLTAQRVSGADAARGLGVGARDYITKPFSPQELLARVHTVLRVEAERREVEWDLKTQAADLGILTEPSRSRGLQPARPSEPGLSFRFC